MIGTFASQPRRQQGPRPRLLAGFLFVPLLALGLPPLTDDHPYGQDKTAPYPRHGQYVTKADCAECHEGEVEKIDGGHHRAVVESKSLQQCETCHGPGKKHADDEDNATELITYPPKLSREGQQTLCGRCHADQIRNHGGDIEGLFEAGKKCTDCHTVHSKIKPDPHSGVAFATREAVVKRAKPVGSQKCVSCHPRRGRLLSGTGHAHLAAGVDATGCETCHGPGSLHVETNGIARLISRPDVAADGVATCRSCHVKVDPTEFHWKDKHKPLLSDGMTCTTCHTVHDSHRAAGGGDRLMAGGGSPRAETGTTPTNAVCAKCHEPALSVLTHTIHAELGHRHTPLQQGCGGCHEGALNHAEHEGRSSLVSSLHGSSAATQMRTCSECHDKDKALRHARSGAHYRNEVTCLSCHSPAAPRAAVREDASRKCTECHKSVAAEFKLPNHHPVAEGRMGCVDCHDPHSARTRIRDRTLRQDNCVKCHKQYRGPFVFAHQASRLDGCIVCHSPHGSTNRRMLKQHTTQQNCLQCHGDYPSFHDQTTGAVFTNCLNCHTEIHGSNHSRFLFR